MFSKSSIKYYLEQEPKFDDIMCSLEATARQPKAMIKEAKEVIALARQFNDEVVRPNALQLDRKVQENPDYLPRDIVEKANEWGLYTMWIPRIFGGRGYSLATFSFFIEEIASACTAISNLIGTHYLGVGTLISTWNARIIKKVLNEVVQGEKTGKPCLISLALTEPDAGTDAEEIALMDKGTITCHAKRVDGGYLINGTKVFISNAHISTWHMLFSYADLSKPSESLVMLAVKNGMEGFSSGRIERKMGQKGCPAGELIFNNCFVPDEYVCIDPDQSKKLKRTPGQSTMQIIDYIFGASRAGVCAFGTGVARGAYELALDFASKTQVEGKLLINHEWAQSMLTKMYKNVQISRLAYVESNYANGMYGLFKLLQMKPVFYIMKYLPDFLINRVLNAVLDSRPYSNLGTRLLRKFHCDHQTDEEIGVPD